MAQGKCVGVDMIELPHAAVRDYPGGYAKWHADMSAKLTREGALAKLPVLGGCKRKDEQSTTVTLKNAATGQISGKVNIPNVTEQRYRDTHLVPRIMTGEIVSCEFEGKTLILSESERCTYTPDWWVVLADGMVEAHEVKGKMVWEDSRIKIKWAAQKYLEVKFVWAQWRGEKWKIREVKR